MQMPYRLVKIGPPIPSFIKISQVVQALLHVDCHDKSNNKGFSESVYEKLS